MQSQQAFTACAGRSGLRDACSREAGREQRARVVRFADDEFESTRGSPEGGAGEESKGKEREQEPDRESNVRMTLKNSGVVKEGRWGKRDAQEISFCLLLGS